MAGNRLLQPPRSLDPQLRLQSRIAELEERLALLERSNNGIARAAFPTSSGLLDVLVPASTRIVVLDFEFEIPFGSNAYLRPNADATSIFNDYMYTASTLSPNTISNPPLAAQVAQPGLWLVGNLGAAGATRAVGQAHIVVANYTGRTVASSDTAYTNTVGSGNNYMTRLRSNMTYDLGAVTSLRFVLSAGNFAGGIVNARFI